MKTRKANGVLQLSERSFDSPYADILEMPILFQKIPVPDTFSGTRNIISAFILSHITV